LGLSSIQKILAVSLISLLIISSLSIIIVGSDGINLYDDQIITNNSQKGLADSPWPRWKGNNQGTGLSPYNTSFVDGTEKWNITLEGKVTSSPVIGPDGTIYVGSNNESLYAINPDGSLKWKENIEHNLYYPPTINKNGTLYFHLSVDKEKLYAYSEEGEQIWNITPESLHGVESNFGYSPVINSNNTIFIEESGGLSAVNPNGTIKWRVYQDEIMGFMQHSPAMDSNGIIYFVTANGYLNAYYPNGTKKWEKGLPIPGGDYSPSFFVLSPVISPDNSIYVIGGTSRSQYFVSVKPDGDIKHKKEQKTSILSQLVLGPRENLYYGNGGFKSIYKNGTLRWSINLEGETIRQGEWFVPAIGADGTIYVRTVNKTIGRFYGINSDGSIKWMISKNSNFTSPAIGSDGTVYVGNENGKLYAIGPSSPTVDITRPSNGESMKTKSVKLEWDSTTLGSDIDHFKVRLDGDDWQNVGSVDEFELTDVSVGDHTAEVKAVAESNNYDIDSIEFTVEEDTTPPTADAGDDRTVKVDEQITFDASDSSDNREITSYEWDFDDGTTATGKTVEHKFDEKGTYEVKLTVIDEAGNTDTDTVTVTVEKDDDNDGIPGFTIMGLLICILLITLHTNRKRR